MCKRRILQMINFGKMESVNLTVYLHWDLGSEVIVESALELDHKAIQSGFPMMYWHGPFL